ncbi:MAG: UvrD-helicase domain-containing protein [Terracidiphilus sp.]
MSELRGPRRPPSDQAERERALNCSRSILVQAPAGSGKTDLLTRRFLSLLSEVNDPAEIVAITFTRAAAAEMRHRILAELEKVEGSDVQVEDGDPISMLSLARRALERSHALGWQLTELPAQLRITTIDSFCRELAIQQPLVSGFGSDLAVNERPTELYIRAARRTLQQIDGNDPLLSAALAELLLWRDNNWQELENQLVEMLRQRDRWMHDFLLQRNPDWQRLRSRLERPFHQAVTEALTQLDDRLGSVPGAAEEAAALARFAHEQSGGTLYKSLAEVATLPSAPFTCGEDLEDARLAYLDLARLALTSTGTFRLRVQARDGFPANDALAEKARAETLIAELSAIDGFGEALANLRSLPPARYTEEDWRIIRACFTLLRHAVGELITAFAEAGTVDFIEIAQIAQRVLTGSDEQPSDAAIDIADRIRHLLVDESQDTSRRQHRLLGSLVAAWPDAAGRTLFVVGDPMQSIYFFRDADAELFMRLRDAGLDVDGEAPLLLDPVRLSANFRSTPDLVDQLNAAFTSCFAQDDGSGIDFVPAVPARERTPALAPSLDLHVSFMPQTRSGNAAGSGDTEKKQRVADERAAARDAETAGIVSMIRKHRNRIESAKRNGAKYRVAVLGRTRDALAPIALALRDSAIPFRAVELEKLRDRPEVLDVLSLARALFNSFDRVAWLGVLRAPWCGLSLSELHTITSADEPDLLRRPMPELLTQRLPLLATESRAAVERVLDVAAAVPGVRAGLPTACLGTWLEQVWLALNGAHCVDAAARANLNLLWRCLDALPGGEQDLLSPALDAALDALTALPDPAASDDCGVQLMTIHKSKGLEFEVVIVPELQAGSAATRGKMLSWFERGLAEPDDSGDITEFLVATLQSKGADRGKAKTWVDRAYAEREQQEMRRILYVASTRAREELHLFTRAEYKDTRGSLILVEPAKCLLATAWPAFGREIEARFAEWSATRAAANPAESTLQSLAASDAGRLIVMPSGKATVIRRLPPEFQTAHDEHPALGVGRSRVTGDRDTVLYNRHEGGALSRALGSAVHKLLEELGRLRTALEWDEARIALAKLRPRLAAQIRAIGATRREAESISASALDYALQASNDPHGQWILSPHVDAASEAAWAGVVAGGLRSVRVDRIFRAGEEPLTEGRTAWWIVDYKTAYSDDLGPLNARLELRSLFAPQLEAYAAILRNLHGKEARIRAALYYPRMLLLDWWEIE